MAVAVTSQVHRLHKYPGTPVYTEEIYRGPYTSHIQTISDVSELGPDWLITFYDRSGHVTKKISSTTGRGTILGIEFEWLESGPGKAILRTSDKIENVGFDYRMEIRLYGTSRVWYTGYLKEIPQQFSRKPPYLYRAAGYYERLKRLIVDESYEDESIGNIFKDLLVDVAGRTGFEVIFNPKRISPNAYRVAEARFKNITLKKALDQLAEIAKNHLVGVDEYREIYFWPTDTLVNGDFIFTEPHDFIDADIKEDMNKLVNKVYPRIGRTASGSNVMDPILDDDSIDQYGLFEKVVDVPSIYAQGNEAVNLVTRWAEGYLANYSQPIIRGTIKHVKQRWDRVLKPFGTCRIIRGDGVEVLAALKKTQYKLNPTAWSITVSLGQADNTFVDTFANLTRAVEFNAAITEMNVGQ